MADNENRTTAPLTLGGNNVSSTDQPDNVNQAGTSNVNNAESEREDYILQLEDQIQELRRTVLELQQQRTQVGTPPVVPAITAQSMPPPLTVPFPTMPQSSQQQLYYPFSTQG